MRHHRYIDATTLPTAPDRLSEEEREIYDAVIAYLHRRRALATADGILAESFAAATARAMAADQSDPRRGVTGARGAAHRGTLLERCTAVAHASARAWARALGLGPGARSRGLGRDSADADADDGEGSALAKLLREPARPRKAQ